MTEKKTFAVIDIRIDLLVDLLNDLLGFLPDNELCLDLRPPDLDLEFLFDLDLDDCALLDGLLLLLGLLSQSLISLISLPFMS